MSQILMHFVDLTIPGLSGRDLVRRPDIRIYGRPRRELGRLDREMLRDIGLDRSAL
jgi:hypothetical protein